MNINDAKEKFGNMVRLEYLRKHYTAIHLNNDIIFQSNITDLHNQETDLGVSTFLDRISHGAANKAAKIWSNAFRMYNVLQYVNRSNLNVVDFGCDTALIRKMIHSGTYHSGTNYVGVDIKYRQLVSASNKMSTCNNPAIFINHDLFRPVNFLRPNSVDVVYAMEIVEHLDEDAGLDFLRCLHKCVKSDGIVIISTPTAHEDKFYLDNKWRKLGYYPHHHREYTVGEFTNLCAKVGFTVEDKYGWTINRKLLLQIASTSHRKLLLRLEEIMGKQIPAQIIGQLYLDVCGAGVYTLRRY